MPDYSTNLNTWGSTGQAPPTNYSYVEGEQPVDAWDNFLMSNIINDIEHLIDVTNNELLPTDGSTPLSGSLTDDQGNTIWDYSAQNVPTGSQEASSVTVTAGDGLKGGGSFSNQGGSTTLDIKPADFAGSGLQDDGNDNIEINQSILYTDEDAQDAVGSALTADFSYDDANDSIGLSFDPATQTELNTHTNDTTNPHNVTDDQTGGSNRPVITDISSLSRGPSASNIADGQFEQPSADEPGYKTVATIPSASINAIWMDAEIRVISEELDSTHTAGVVVDGNIATTAIGKEDGWKSVSSSTSVANSSSVDVEIYAEGAISSTITVEYRNVIVDRETQVVDF